MVPGDGMNVHDERMSASPQPVAFDVEALSELEDLFGRPRLLDLLTMLDASDTHFPCSCICQGEPACLQGQWL